MSNSALYVDPATAIMVAEASYKMWKSAQEARKAGETVKLLKQIGAKLDVVIRKQDEVLTELRSLKVFFQDELRRQFLNEVQFGMAAHRDSFEVVASLVGVDNNAALSRVKELELPTRNFSFNLLQRGVAAFTVALPAAVLHLAVLNLQRELHVKEQVIKTLELAFLAQWEEQFLRWFQPDHREGLLFPLRLLREAREALQQQIEAYARLVPLGSFDTGREHHSERKSCQIHRQRTLVVTGDLKSGFADHYEDGADFVSTKCQNVPWDRFGPSAGAVPELLLSNYDPTDPLSLVSREDLEKMVPTGSYYQNAKMIAYGVDGEGVVPVNHPHTQALNTLRTRWITALADETGFAAFVKIVQDTRAEFATRAKELR